MFANTGPRIAFIAGLYIAVIGAWASAPAYAEAKDETDEIEIRADYMRFDLESGDSIYQGNVSIAQGTIQLTGDKVVIHRNPDKDREITDIEVSGKPARYQQDDNTERRVHAVSRHMKYSARDSRLVMTQDARLEQAGQTVESQRIVYDTENKVIIAGKNGKDRETGERVNITLTPNKDEDQNKANPGESSSAPASR